MPAKRAFRGSGAQAGGLILNVYTGASGTFIENWNPFSPTGLTDVQGMIYESLFFFNALKPLVIGLTLESIIADMAGFWRRLWRSLTGRGV